MFDYDFVDKINTRYKLMSDKTAVTIGLDAVMGLAGRIVGSAAGPVAAVVVGTMWAAVKEAGKPKKITGKISEIRGKVVDVFAAAIHAADKTDIAISGDWGLLREFGELVHSGKIEWPKDNSAMRNAHAYAFHYESLRVLVSLRSKSTPTYSHWGVASRRRSAKSPQKRQWHPKSGKYHLTTKSKESCGSHYYMEYFLGSMRCSYVAMAGLVCDPQKELAKALQKKMFGVNTKDDIDPDLGLPSRFLDNPKCKERKGWSIDDFGSY